MIIMDSDVEMLTAERKQWDGIDGKAVIYVFRHIFGSTETKSFYFTEEEFEKLIAQFRDGNTSGMRVIGQSKKNNKAHE